MIKKLIEKLDNDSIIIIGLIIIAVVYSTQADNNSHIVSNIVSGLVGYLGGQYINQKRDEE